jgi:lysophospholipase L1-like esterase
MRRKLTIVLPVLGALLGALLAGCGTQRSAMHADTVSSFRHWNRVAVIGHSFTDGNTWPYLVRQALAEAGRPEPILINAAAGGDVARDNLRRLDWAVLQYEPDLAIILTSAHNVGHMTDDEFRAAMEEMIVKLQARGATVLLMYGRLRCPDGMEPADMQDAARVRDVVSRERAAMASEAARPESERHAEEQIHRDLAAKHQCLIANMKPCLLASFEQGNWLWEPDRSHLSFAGYRAVARAALDALGGQDVAVPEKLKVKVLPGLLTPLRMRAAGEGEGALDDAAAAAVRPDDTWVTYALPEKEPLDSWWSDQVRQEGYAMSLEKVLGKAGRYIGYATVHSVAPATACVNTSGGLKTVWFNGTRIYTAGKWNGFHAGAERIAVQLNAGTNTVVFESGPQFALTVTPEALW